MESNKSPQPLKLNWWNITKKYWKEQIIFYILTTLSCVAAAIIDANGISNLWDIAAFSKKEKVLELLKFKVFDKVVVEKFSSVEFFLLFMAGIVILYCLMVIAHVFYAYWLGNKITQQVKKDLMKKLFQLEGVYDRKKALALFNHDSRLFGYNLVFFPNQIYYVILSSGLGFYFASKAGGSLVWWGTVYLLSIITAVLLFAWFLYKKDSKLRQISEEEVRKEDIIINNRDLIIKKGMAEPFQQKYQKSVDRTISFTNKRDWTYTLYWVTPAFSLITYADFIFLPLVLGKGKDALTAMKMFGKVFSGGKKSIERCRDYPYYFAAKKRLNHFLALPERNDIQKNILVSEPVKKIELQKVSFGYEKNKLVINKMNLKFERGKINYLRGENGFGKSTIISLLMGLYQPQKGEILINDKFKLNEINLMVWRKEKIAYAEHENLIENGLSTGQKQLADLNNLFANSPNKEVFIFDEADNALDGENREEFRQKIEKVSKKNLVILVSH
ncbi:MAG: ABC transporter ATP-binding protein/permease [Candidatus Moeniiplasma glomeromycotorum]|nr:ABC transporter ATP-binding protein/permease [Candidatus Moeniiplasma glomeromycotorum]MCE8167413.1 ABC transporter ATP-binding protein/permease [Candidatus Moeniiplasma glomeromycotorum]MCE8168573.1 ABC transporter ATP-binding protein/permease [Candidatus Moeniiplasma glomeromycotorum]